MLTVADAMTPNPICVHANDPVPLLAKRLLDHDIRHLPVLDSLGAIAGVVTAARVFHLGTFTGPQGQETWQDFTTEGAGTAADILDEIELSAALDTPLITAIRRLIGSIQDVLLVVDERRHPVGILTEHDGVKLAQAMLSPTQKAASWKDDEVRSIEGSKPAHEALALMTEQRSRHLLVSHMGEFVSVVARFDLLRVGAQSRRNLTVMDAASRRELRTEADGLSLREVARIFHTEKIGCLPLRDEAGAIARVITRRDVLEGLARAIETEELFEVEPAAP